MQSLKVAVLGLGYVGLPLAVAISRFHDVTAYDLSSRRVKEITECFFDSTRECTREEIARFVETSLVTNDCSHQGLWGRDVYIVTVPTPINRDKEPDLSALASACRVIGPLLKKKSVVVFESTVYPGVCEDFCAPILEKASGLKFLRDFEVGYSPERINPGDANHKLENIVKIISASSDRALNIMERVYDPVVTAGLHRVSAIKIAEAAKVIENIQRDVNIGLINELCVFFHKLGLNSSEILKAAQTKWNFLSFEPGLVGGHCIGVDPYYLMTLAANIGHNLDIVSAAREVNESIVGYIGEVVEQKVHGLNRSPRLIIFGLTFKEDCPDYRNSGAVKLALRFISAGFEVSSWDPFLLADSDRIIDGQLLDSRDIPTNHFDVVIVAVKHEVFSNLGCQHFRAFLNPTGILMDLKGAFAPTDSDWKL